MTPLLHAAKECTPQAVRCTKILIKRGANLRATNEIGQGAFHCALEGPHSLYRWRSLQPHLQIEDDVVDDEWRLRVIYYTDNDNPAEDYSDEWSVEEQRENKANSKNPPFWSDMTTDPAEIQDNAWPELSSEMGNIDEWDMIHDFLQGGPDNFDNFMSFPVDDSSAADVPTTEDDMPEYIFCRDFEGVQRLIRSPIRVLKTRLRYLLLLLLEAGCDPNTFDDEGASPSDYARRDHLLPQWRWALQRAGYKYDEGSGRWAKVAISN